MALPYIILPLSSFKIFISEKVIPMLSDNLIQVMIKNRIMTFKANIKTMKLLPPSLHYRLRGSIGFLNVQKVSKSRLLFLTEGTSKTDNFALFVKIMTQILC